MATDLADLAIKIHSDEVQVATSRLDSLRSSGERAEQSVTKLESTTSRVGSGMSAMSGSANSAEKNLSNLATTSTSVAASMLELVGVITTVYATYKTLSEAISYGMRVETLGVAMNAVAKTVGVSSDAVKLFANEVKSAGVTTEESYSAMTKAMILGLDVNKLKDLATAARNVAVVAGKNTSDTFADLMHGIESGNVRIFHTLGVAVRDQKTVFDEYALSIGKAKGELNQVERNQAMYNEALRATGRFQGIAADADATAGKQLASLDRVVKDTYESFWGLFGPGMTAGIKGLTDAFKDLQKWASANSDVLDQAGQSVGQFVAKVGLAGLAVAEWGLRNSDLIKTLAELYIITKLIAWVQGLYAALMLGGTAATIFGGIIQGLPIIFGTAAAETVVFSSGVAGMSSAMTIATGSAVALQGAMATLVPALVTATAALAVYGAYKSFTGSPGGAGPVPEAAQAAPEAWYSAGPTQENLDADKARTAKENFVGPPSPDKQTLEMNKLRSRYEEFSKEFSNMSKKAAAESPSPPGKSGGGGGGGKGASTEGAENRLSNMIDTYQKELAKLVEGSRAEIDAWYNEQINKIGQIGAKGIETEEAIALAGEVKNSKLKKLEDDFSKWYAQNSDDRLKQLDIERSETLKKYKGSKEEEAKINRIYDQKISDEKIARENELISKQTSLMSGEAGLFSTSYKDQLKLQERILDLEQKSADANLIIWARKNGISDSMRDELRSVQALVTEQKKYQIELEKEGFTGGLKAWGIKRSQDAAKRDYTFGNTIMDSLESGAKSFGADIAKGMFEEGKIDFANIGLTMAENFVSALIESRITAFFDQIAQSFANSIASSGGSSSGGGFLGSIGSIFSTFFGGSSGGSAEGSFTPTFWHNGGLISRYHRGGLIFAHGGLNLAPDEVPIIAQTGERVLSREQNKAYESGTNFNLTIQNNTGTPIGDTSVKQLSEKDFMIMLDKANAQLVNSGGTFSKAVQQKWNVSSNTVRR